MAADVTYLMRLIKGAESSTAPITRDLLGGGCVIDSKNLDLDLQVPCGWEKRLDLKSGKVYIEKCNSSVHDLNFPPPSKALNLFEESTLELKLVSSSSPSTSPPTSCNYQSVCTLDKIKSALERAEKNTLLRKRSSSSPCSTSSSSIKDNNFNRDETLTATVAAACPGCFLYVLIARDNPRCPRCNRSVPLHVATKKPRIDLNICI